jgi:hypothetical protein
MEYYISNVGTANAFMGFDNSTGNMFIASNVNFTANDVVGVNSYGTLQAGNLYIQSAVSTGNITGGNLNTAGNVVGGNLVTAGVTDTGTLTVSGTSSFTGNITSPFNVTGNITAGNLSAGSGIILTTGNITGGNILTSGIVSATSNITGGNINTAGQLQGGNIVISGDDITDTNGRVNFNTAAGDVDFAVNGDTLANIFYVDAGTGTASFGTSTQTVNAIVAFNSTTSILAPVGNTAQRPATGVTGMLRFNTTNNAVEVYNNTEWESVGVQTFTLIADEQFNGDGSTVAFTLGSTQTTNSCIVSINGVVQIPTIAYSVSGVDPTCVLTFTEAPAAADLIDVRQLTTTTSVTSIASSSGNAVVSTSETAANVDVTGNLVISGSVSAAGFIGLDATSIANGTSSMTVVSSGGNIRANVGGTTVQTISAGLVAITGDLSVTGNATLSGNILGDRIQNGTTSFDIQTASGNANINIGGTGNLAVFTPGNLLMTGNITPTANITYDLGTTTNRWKDIYLSNSTIYMGNAQISANATSLTFTNPQGGQTVLAGASSVISAAGNISTGSNVVIGSAGNSQIFNSTVNLEIVNNVSTGNINFRANVNGGGDQNVFRVLGTGGVGVVGNLISLSANGAVANGVSNIGSASGTFNTIFAKATSAQYADLAEKYTADADYAPGTVVMFGGSAEITLCVNEACPRVAGVISTNPSYRMNDGLQSEHTAMVALTGRVPTRVTGTVRKGDIMVSAGNGQARAEGLPRVGTVIGKALEDFDGAEGTIEVVVGRF